MQKNKRSFTLLEIMLAISIIVMAGGVLSWKLHGMLEKKRFSSSVERLSSRMVSCRFLALNMQADWKGILRKQTDSRWVFEAFCVEAGGNVPSLKVDFSAVDWEGEKTDKVEFLFTATGHIIPAGKLQLWGARGQDHILFVPDLR